MNILEKINNFKISEKQFGLIFLFLSLISITSAGFLFRASFTYWFFTGTSVGKTVVFFIFATIIYLVPKPKFVEKIPKISFILIFIIALIGYGISFYGVEDSFNKYVYDLNFENNSDTWIITHYKDAKIQINWVRHIHNHYLKPTIIPITYFVRNFSVDSALPISTIINPMIFIPGSIVTLLGFILLIIFLLQNKGEKFFFLYLLNGFGLVLSIIDGGIISAITQINICFFAVLMIHKYAKNLDGIKKLILSFAAIIIIVEIFKIISTFIIGGPVGFLSIIYPPALVIALLLNLNEKSITSLFKPFVVILLIVIVVHSFYNHRFLFYETETYDDVGTFETNSFVVRFENTPIEFNEIGSSKQVGPNTVLLKTNKDYSFSEIFDFIENKNEKAVILFNSSWKLETK